jgi:hypothetical protein
MDWNQVIDQAHADHLMEQFGEFHDGCVHELHLWTGYSVSSERSMTCTMGSEIGVRVLIQRQSDELSAIELLFQEVKRLNIVAPVNRDSIIYGATLLLRDGTIYWSPESNWVPESTADAVTFISAKRLAWRDASEWMGESFRLGTGPPVQV